MSHDGRASMGMHVQSNRIVMNSNTEDEPVVMTFRIDPKGNLTSSHKGFIVFVDSNYEGIVENGETWVCNLEFNQKGRCWYSKPLMKMDAEYFLDATKKQMLEIADCLMAENPESVQPYLREIVEGDLGRKVEDLRVELKNKDKEMMELRKELKDVRSMKESPEKDHEIEMLKSRIEDLTNSNAALSESAKIADIQTKRADESERIIRKLEEEARCDRFRSMELEMETKRRLLQIDTMNREMQSRRDCVNPDRIGYGHLPKYRLPDSQSRYALHVDPEEIRYAGFKGTRYSVSISRDGKELSVVQDDDGRVRCVDGTLILSGLDNYIPFNGKRYLKTDDDGTTVRIHTDGSSV